MERIKLKVLGLSYSETQSGAYALVLAEEDGERRIPIIIGAYEAQAIAIELENLKPPRPLTHDLFVLFATTFNIDLSEVNIYKLEEGVFYSNLVFNKGSEKVTIDARTSDSVALALRFKCPIYTTEAIAARAGIIINPDQTISEQAKDTEQEQHEKTKSKENPFYSLSIAELEEALEEAINNEDYEKASQIRDEIKRRKKE